MKISFIVLSCVLAFASTTSFAAKTYISQPGPSQGQDLFVTNVYFKDAGSGIGDELDPVDSGKYGSYLSRCRVGGWGDHYDCLIKFDLSDLPDASIVTSATIRMYTYDAVNNGGTPMYMDRVTSYWDESFGWFSGIISVRTEDYLPIAPRNDWYEIDVTELYKGWKDGVYPNQGIRLKPHNVRNNYNEFFTSDHTDASLRPMIVVETNESDQTLLTFPVYQDGDVYNIAIATVIDSSESTDVAKIGYSYDLDRALSRTIRCRGNSEGKSKGKAKGHAKGQSACAEDDGLYKKITGYNFVVLENSPVFASADGTVERINGGMVVINHGDVKTRYVHVDALEGLVVGQSVVGMEQIGTATKQVHIAGNPNSTAIHFSVISTKDNEPVDPYGVLNADTGETEGSIWL